MDDTLEVISVTTNDSITLILSQKSEILFLFREIVSNIGIWNFHKLKLIYFQKGNNLEIITGNKNKSSCKVCPNH